MSPTTTAVNAPRAENHMKEIVNKTNTPSLKYEKAPYKKYSKYHIYVDILNKNMLNILN